MAAREFLEEETLKQTTRHPNTEFNTEGTGNNRYFEVLSMYGCKQRYLYFHK